MDYKLATTTQEIKDYVNGAKLLALDLETSPKTEFRNDEKVGPELPAALDSHKATITGLSLAVEAGTSGSQGSGIYIPFLHKIGVNADFNTIWVWLKENILLNPEITVVIHNAAFESAFFYALGVIPKCKVYDTMAAAQLTLKTKTQFRNLSDSGLKTLVSELLKIELPTFESVTEGKFFDELDSRSPETIRYACADSDFALRLYHLINDWFDKNLSNHRFIAEKIESPTAVYVGIMKHNGLLMDINLMQQKQEEAAELLRQLKENLSLMTGGVEVGKNASTKAFKGYLYTHLDLPILKTTEKKSGAADDEALLLLEDYCKKEKPEFVPLLKMVREYRKVGKIKSTYIDGFLTHVNTTTKCIHPDFWQLGAESGRFSCRTPNFQNLSSGAVSEQFNVRDFVIAPEGQSIIEADFSQVELKIAAFLSKDPLMLHAYQKDEDIHAITTSAIFKIPLEKSKNKSDPLYKKRRTVAKSTIFGVLYGIYKNGLSRNLKVSAGIDLSPDHCALFIDKLKQNYHELASWQHQTIATAKFKQCVETTLGRRRYIPKIVSPFFKERSYAERIALNHGVQGLAADCLKLSMARLVQELPKYPYLKPILTVHDSLVFLCPDKEIRKAARLIKKCMETPPPIFDFNITLNADVSVGKSYGSLTELEVTP